MIVAVSLNTNNFIFVSIQQELERLWNARSNVPWGLPSKSFDEELALMLMDSDDDIECDSVSAPCTDEAEGNNSSELDAKEEDLSIVNVCVAFQFLCLG